MRCEVCLAWQYRELQNLIERSVILTQGRALRVPLTELTPSTAPATTTLKDTERAQILKVLKDTGWVIGGLQRAAARLGMKRTTLASRRTKLGILRPRHA